MTGEAAAAGDEQSEDVDDIAAAATIVDSVAGILLSPAECDDNERRGWKLNIFSQNNPINGLSYTTYLLTYAKFYTH